MVRGWGVGEASGSGHATDNYSPYPTIVEAFLYTIPSWGNIMSKSTIALILCLSLITIIGIPIQAQSACSADIDYVTLGNQQLANGDGQSALNSFNCAIQANANVFYLYNSRGNAHRQLGNFSEAISDYTQSIDLYPDYAIAYSNRGWAYFNIGEYNLALEDLNRAIELDDSLAYAYNNRGVVYQALGNDDLAMADFQSALDLNDPQAGEWAFYNLSVATRESQQISDIIPDITNNTSDNTDLDTLLDQADEAYDDRDFERAAELYEQIFAIQFDDSFIGFRLGFALGEINEWERAIQVYEQVLELDYSNPQYIYNNIGVGYLDLNDPETAIPFLDQAIEIDPEYARAYYNRAIGYFDSGDYEQSVVDNTRAIEIDPEYRSAYINRADSYEELGDFENAFADMEVVISLTDEPTASDYLKRGFYAVSAGEREIAAPDYWEYIQANKMDEFIRESLSVGDSAELTMSDGAIFYFTIDLEAGQTVHLETITSEENVENEADAVILILDSNATPISVDDDNGEGFMASLDFTAPENATYTVIISHAGGNPIGDMMLIVENVG